MRSNTYDLSLQGRLRPDVQVQLYGMFQGWGAVPSVCTQYAQRLIRELDCVAIHSYNGGTFLDPALHDFAFVNPDAAVGIFYGFPNEIAPVFFAHRVRIGAFVCETDRIDPGWVQVCNHLHLVIVPSTFCRTAFLDSGVEVPVIVVPHGLEREYRPYGDKKRTRPFVFYNTCFASSHLDRKSIDELVRAFLRAFGNGGEECILRLRTDLSRQLVDIRLRHDFGRAIRLDPLTGIDVADFARIYSDVHCTVHPSKGEGFGMIPLQSIACETPVIAPAVTGMADYLNESNAMCLRTSGRVRGQSAGNQAGSYYSIDEDHLVDLLRRAYHSWEEEYDKVRTAAQVVRERYSWHSVLSPLVDIVRNALSAKDASSFGAEMRLYSGKSRLPL